MRTRDDIVAAARGCVGARFRLHGRDPALGLDCAGLAAHATGLAAPSGYALRGGDPRAIAVRVTAAGARPIPLAAAGAGDLLLLGPGPAQVHLAVLTDAGFIHAHAGLRRVVETPGAPVWPVLGAWRAGGEG